MDTVLLVVLILVIVATFALAYFAFKTSWRWPHVTLVVLNILASIFFLGLAARTLKTHNAWRSTVQKYQQEIEKHTAMIDNLRDGQGEDPGVVQLKSDLFRFTLNRGEVWREISPNRPDPRSGAVTLNLNPKIEGPHGLPDKATLYLFSSAAPGVGGSYLGKFRVASVKDRAVTVEPVAPMSDFERTRLTRSPGPWIAYFVLPIDDPEYLASLPAAERDALFKGNAELNRLAADATRAPRDFAVEFDYLRLQEDLLLQEADQTANEIERLNKALSDAQNAIKYREQEKSQLAQDLKQFRYELEQTKKVLASVQTYLQENRTDLKTVLAETRNLVSTLTKMQLSDLRKDGT